MSLFFDFLIKMIPLYVFILLGFLAGKYLNVKKETIASLLIYVITPIIVFNGSYTTKIDVGHLSLPFLFLILCCMNCLFFYFVGKKLWKDSTKNILAFAAGSANVGYFGLPVALALFGDDALSIVVLIVMGFVLYENTLGFFIVARGNYSLKESMKKLSRLPSIYTFVVGLSLNLLKIPMGQIYLDAITNARGAYTLLGMMMIGVAIAGINGFRMDWLFTFMAFLVKFIVWPLIILGIIFLDSHYFNVFSPLIYKIMVLLSIVPLAANTVAYATELKTHPEKAAFAVLLSTIFALFYIPFINSIYLSR